MSYIDTFDHELVGFLGGLPIYHPLVNWVIADEGDEFSCHPGQLVLGGGLGEHPGLVLKRPALAATHFVMEWMKSFEVTQPQRAIELKDELERWDSGFIESQLLTVGAAFYFAGWRVEEYHRFFELCSGDALILPYDKTQKISFEDWLLANFGEFILFSMPELVSDIDLEQFQQVRQTIKQETRHPLYMNILIPPPGYPLPYGRKLKSDRVAWGQIRWWPQEGE